MKKTTLSKVLAFVFICSVSIPTMVTLSSCSSKKGRYNSPRNGGQKIHSSGKVGNTKHKNSHVWGK